MTDGRAPFYERHRWKAVAAVVALVGAVWALSGAPTPWKLVSDITTEELPASNTMVVVDLSDAMARSFGKRGTRLDAARDAVARFTLPMKNEGLALRAFGGSCTDPGRVLVDFGSDHGDDVRNAIAEQQPGGRSNLVNTVRAAIDDFADDRFEKDGPRRIVVFAGSVDDCTGSSDLEDIRDEMEHGNVDATFKLVGLDLGEKGRKRLVAFKKAIGGPAEVAFVENPTELDSVAGWLDKESSGVSECADGVDNDGDDAVDDDDSDCESGDSETSPQTAGECSDGDDNDGDGTTDGDDPDCQSGDSESSQPSGNCSDGLDNDGDDATDGDDEDCATGDTETSQQPSGECADGIDNDGDGLRDEDDPGCDDGAEASA